MLVKNAVDSLMLLKVKYSVSFCNFKFLFLTLYRQNLELYQCFNP